MSCASVTDDGPNQVSQNNMAYRNNAEKAMDGLRLT